MGIFIKLIQTMLSINLALATTFSANDKYNPNPKLFCTNKDLNDETDSVVAHPKIKCGSSVLIYNIRTKKSTIATVQDRGPRHKYGIDLSPLVAKRLKSNGMEPVLFMKL